MSDSASSADQLVSEEADSSKYHNASSTRTTFTTTTSVARLLQPMTSTTTRTDSEANISTRESASGSNDPITAASVDAKRSQQTNGSKNVDLADTDFSQLSADQLKDKWDQQQVYTQSLEHQVESLQQEQQESHKLKESNDKLKEQLFQATRRENILILRLTSKDKEMIDLKSHLDSVKKQVPTIPSESSLQKALVDPAVNLVFERMKKEVEDARAKVSDMQSELSAWKFTPDSTTGKRLMAKCRLLYQENEELGKMISSGKVAKLEGELALQRNFAEEIKKSQSEIDDFLVELDEDFEGMQSTITGLQAQLKEVKDQLLSFQSNMFKSGEEENGDVNAATATADVMPEVVSGSAESAATAVADAGVESAEIAAEAPLDSLLLDERSSTKRAGEEDSTQDTIASKRSKSDEVLDSDAVITCSLDSGSIADSSEATATQ